MTTFKASMQEYKIAQNTHNLCRHLANYILSTDNLYKYVKLLIVTSQKSSDTIVHTATM